MEDAYISIRNYTKILSEKTVLNNVSLNIRKNTTVGFAGKNGSGKTMLFRAIGGLIKPTSGEISIDGKVLGKDISFPANMGIIIENISLWRNLSGFDSLKLLASINGKIDNKQIRESISRVGLDPDDKRQLSKYSLGMKQRLIIAQAIMEKPELLILDEPTNALDADGVELARDIFIQEQKRGATILIASHSAEDIGLLCSECYHMCEGRIVD